MKVMILRDAEVPVTGTISTVYPRDWIGDLADDVAAKLVKLGKAQDLTPKPVAPPADANTNTGQIDPPEPPEPPPAVAPAATRKTRAA
jgi:hypothetical protein